MNRSAVFLSKTWERCEKNWTGFFYHLSKSQPGTVIERTLIQISWINVVVSDVEENK